MHSQDTTTLQQRNNISVIIAAAGSKYGLGGNPVSLLPIKNSTLIDYQYRTIKKFLPKSDIILVGGFEFDKLRNKIPSDIILIKNDKYAETNNVYSISLGLDAAKNNDVLVIHGNIFFKENIMHCPWTKSFIFCSDAVLSDNKKLGCVIDKTVDNIMYGLPYNIFKITFLRNKELSLYKQFCFDKTNQQAYDWEILNKIIDNGGKFYPHFKKNIDCLEIDCFADIKRI